ncbi:2-dehydro-3-deoxy-6-phosphogalactonate aldolase [uncultured Cohaesibacter sp.]|uniref:2-dehydro-3-deoxy-6-phosphogalactonate aldolase n=1 Tax=uncultured Cohaesibacter sp. TaxID=1002546 RepID=UPI0029C82754|nr:2-dehydro-3-deoxy-6-phosphogalactonate aldolase [uncultured Cohaesibacter sp.]
MDFEKFVGQCPLVAILRGVTPEEVLGIGQVLVDSGFSIIEVPLNSPRPFESISILQESLGRRALIGAGTVLSTEAVEGVAAAGGKLIVMPHSDTEVIAHAKSLGLSCVPGVVTPTEAFAALKAGADALKLFPAEIASPAVVKAMLAVLPKSTRILPVGGISPETMDGYLAAGAAGFGLGSALYKAGMSADEVAVNAAAFIKALEALKGKA